MQEVVDALADALSGQIALGEDPTATCHLIMHRKHSNVTVLQTQRYVSTDRDHGRERDFFLFGGHDGTTRDR